MERWNCVLVLRGFWLQGGGHWVHPGCADGQPQLNVRGVRDGQRTVNKDRNRAQGAMRRKWHFKMARESGRSIEERVRRLLAGEARAEG